MRDSKDNLVIEIWELSGNRLWLYNDAKECHSYPYQDLLDIRNWLKDLITKQRKG
jgi:hypothetical protein